MSSDEQLGEDDHGTAKPSSEHNDDRVESDDEDDDTDSNASSEYEVEKILSKRRRRRGGGEYEYFIKWVGYDDSANEWIPESSLNCPERLAEFRREELRQQRRASRNNERKHRGQGRRTASPPRKRRIKVLHDDDDEDDDDEPAPKSIESSNSSTAQSSTASKADPTDYGVQRGYKVQAILGINRTKSDQLHYLVHYKSPTIFEDNMELIPANVAKQYCEDEIIQFYETRISWNNPSAV